MDKKAYLYIVEAGQFSFEVEIKELLGKVGDTFASAQTELTLMDLTLK